MVQLRIHALHVHTAEYHYEQVLRRFDIRFRLPFATSSGGAYAVDQKTRTLESCLSRRFRDSGWSETPRTGDQELEVTSHDSGTYWPELRFL